MNISLRNLMLLAVLLGGLAIPLAYKAYRSYQRHAEIQQIQQELDKAPDVIEYSYTDPRTGVVRAGTSGGSQEQRQAHIALLKRLRDLRGEDIRDIGPPPWLPANAVGAK